MSAVNIAARVKDLLARTDSEVRASTAPTNLPAALPGRLECVIYQLMASPAFATSDDIPHIVKALAVLRCQMALESGPVIERPRLGRLLASFLAPVMGVRHG